jgi:hypothetical protein
VLCQGIAGVLGCFDRLVVTGTLTEIAHPEAMDSLLCWEGFRVFDIGLFADPLRQRPQLVLRLLLSHHTFSILTSLCR